MAATHPVHDAVNCRSLDMELADLRLPIRLVPGTADAPQKAEGSDEALLMPATPP